MALFSTQPEGNALTIRLEVETLEAANAAEFKREVSLVELPEDGTVAVDCTSVGFIDSSGIGALLHLNNQLSDATKPVVLRHMRPEVLSVIELLRLNTVFELEA